MYRLTAKKLVPRKPITDLSGKVIDNGDNKTIVLYELEDEHTAKFLFERYKENMRKEKFIDETQWQFKMRKINR